MIGKRKVRVFIVDDSSLSREILINIFKTDKTLEVVGWSEDGVIALEEIKRLKPDVVTMDYQMPKITGAEATKNILNDVQPPPSIIMVSSFTEEGAEETFESLRAGAVDFIQKPEVDKEESLDDFQNRIIEKIHIAAEARIISSKEHKLVLEQKKASPRNTDSIVVIGSSTGGPPIVEDICRSLPGNFNSAVLVVQHMPENFTLRFSNRIDKFSPLKVKNAENGEEVLSGFVYFAPGGYRTGIVEKEGKYYFSVVKELDDSKPQPSINDTMFSVAEHYKERALGIILTGMGNDGSEGMASIKKFGGKTIVQDPETAVISSMPNSVIESKHADEVLNPSAIIKLLINSHGRSIKI